MADRFLKDINGAFQKDSSGNLLKDRPFSETVIQDGLIFWGSADPNYLTLVSGLVSEAYDIRGNGNKMIQNTVANRFKYSLDGARYAIDSNAVAQSLVANFTTNSIKTFFLVARNYGANGSGATIEVTSVNGSTTLYVGITYANNTSYAPAGRTYYKNLTKLTTVSAVSTNIVTLHTLTDFASAANAYGALCNAYSTFGAYAYEWGWYNRVLNEQEVIYNQNAMITKYGIV